MLEVSATHPLVAAALEADNDCVGPRGRGRPPGEGTTFASKADSLLTREYRERLISEGLSEGDLLANDELAPPQISVQREKVIHRAMVMMHAQGKSLGEIAEAFDYSKGQVGMVLRQPWARKQLIQVLTECGKDLVTEALASSALDSVHVLIEIRDDPKEKGSTRVGAANSLLDRHLGKPTQRVELAKGTPALQDIDDLDAELARLRAQQDALTLSSPRAEGEQTLDRPQS